jgi:hypothetical protein
MSFYGVAMSSSPLGRSPKCFLLSRPLGQRSGITKNSVNKTVRENAAELLSDERSEEFNESSVHEKVFSCFIVAGELFGYFLAIQKVTW